MKEQSAVNQKMTTYLITCWIAINILIMLLLLPQDYMDGNNWIELALWSSSLVGLWAMRKWGIALTTFTLIYTLSISVSIVIYYQVWLNIIRIVINGTLIIYMFRRIFAVRFPVE